MRLVIARCTVDYSGRLNAHLPEATRLIMVKADGTLAIHSDGGLDGPVGHLAVTDLDHDGVDEHQRIHTRSSGRICHSDISSRIRSVIREMVSRETSAP
jgi:endonuclease